MLLLLIAWLMHSKRAPHLFLSDYNLWTMFLIHLIDANGEDVLQSVDMFQVQISVPTVCLLEHTLASIGGPTSNTVAAQEGREKRTRGVGPGRGPG